jgi:diguanylate cyclase (GGDEF)-like protein
VANEFELEQRARYDQLTGLLNRKEVLDRLDALRRRRPRTGRDIAAVFCDVDEFKAINDTHGHVAGDELLRVIAERMRASVRSGDTVARFGGDEILVILDGVHDLDEAVRIAKKLHREVRQPIAIPGGSVRATLSVGVTLATADESIDTLLSRADQAMYEAKQAGRDEVIPLPARS